VTTAHDFEELVSSATDETYLVSVRDLDEFDLVTNAGVPIVDFKDPLMGPLSPTSEKIWELVEKQVRAGCGVFGPKNDRSGVLLSAALGERDQAVTAAKLLPDCFHFAKAGPSDCFDACVLTALWKELRSVLPAATELVAVAYADWQLANAMQPLEILRLAADQGIKRFLIDTFTKDGRSLIDFLDLEDLGRLRRFAADRKIWFAVAGSIKQREVERLDHAGFVPDCYAVRGVVCGSGGRASAICKDQLFQWQDYLRTRRSVMPNEQLN
jgi:uncharacterized protein (UPF0264 family)